MTVIKDLKERKKAVGTMIRMIRNSAIASMAKNAGLDYILLDLEHGPYTMETVDEIFKVGRSLGIGCFVRVPELSKGYVSRIMDSGANGVMVPMLETVEQAKNFVKWAKYAPLGDRGFGGFGGHTEYKAVGGKDTPGFMATANAETLTIAQIETATAIKNIEEIAAVPGLDALLIGPNDLAISLGCAGDLMGETLDKAIGKVCDAAKKNGKTFGLHAPDGLLERWIPKGCNLIMSSMDGNFVASGLSDIAKKYKG